MASGRCLRSWIAEKICKCILTHTPNGTATTTLTHFYSFGCAIYNQELLIRMCFQPRLQSRTVVNSLSILDALLLGMEVSKPCPLNPTFTVLLSKNHQSNHSSYVCPNKFERWKLWQLWTLKKTQQKLWKTRILMHFFSFWRLCSVRTASHGTWGPVVQVPIVRWQKWGNVAVVAGACKHA